VVFNVNHGGIKDVPAFYQLSKIQQNRILARQEEVTKAFPKGFDGVSADDLRKFLSVKLVKAPAQTQVPVGVTPPASTGAGACIPCILAEQKMKQALEDVKEANKEYEAEVLNIAKRTAERRKELEKSFGLTGGTTPDSPLPDSAAGEHANGAFIQNSPALIEQIQKLTK
jgi:hypothetical protein